MARDCSTQSFDLPSYLVALGDKIWKEKMKPEVWENVCWQNVIGIFQNIFKKTIISIVRHWKYIIESIKALTGWPCLGCKAIPSESDLASASLIRWCYFYNLISTGPSWKLDWTESLALPYSPYLRLRIYTNWHYLEYHGTLKNNFNNNF